MVCLCINPLIESYPCEMDIPILQVSRLGGQRVKRLAQTHMFS